MQYNITNRGCSEKNSEKRKSNILFSVIFLCVFSFKSTPQDLYKWVEIRFSIEPPSKVPEYYNDLSNFVKEIYPYVKALKNEHSLNFLRKHSLRQVIGISYFKALHPDISDSVLALSALLTGLQETYLDKMDQAGAASLSVFQAFSCGLRIDNFIDERFNIYESLKCMQHWMRRTKWDIISLVKQGGLESSLTAWRQTYSLMYSYFKTITPAEVFDLKKTYAVQTHEFDVLLSQWIISKNDIRQCQALNPALRTEVIPENYPVKIPMDVEGFNEPKSWIASEGNHHQNEEKNRSKTLYTVKRGDTLTAIARRFGTTVQAIKAENHLKSDNITPGLRLVIPADR